jgi:imidazolonepropionase
MLLGCLFGEMTPVEVLRSVTISAAKALGQLGQIGSLEVGKAADFAVIDSPDLAHWVYHFRGNACVATFVRGEPVWSGSRTGSLEESNR